MLLHKSGVSIERGVHFPYMSTKDVLVSSAFFKGISYDKWPINMAMAFFFFFPPLKTLINRCCSCLLSKI